MAKAKWTDWIAHVPGQEVPAGFEIRVEFLDRKDRRNILQGVTGPTTKKHPCWYATDQYGIAKMITRYKLRVIEDEATDDARLARKVKEPA